MKYLASCGICDAIETDHSARKIKWALFDQIVRYETLTKAERLRHQKCGCDKYINDLMTHALSNFNTVLQNNFSYK